MSINEKSRGFGYRRMLDRQGRMKAREKAAILEAHRKSVSQSVSFQPEQDDLNSEKNKENEMVFDDYAATGSPLEDEEHFANHKTMNTIEDDEDFATINLEDIKVSFCRMNPV
jgi:hypothetical protein